jgi:hypothetical protein
MIRRSWEELPDGVRAAAVRHCGAMLGESTAPAGRHSEFSATLRVSGGDTVPAGHVFVKGITTDSPGMRAHRHEANVNPALPDLAPRLLWTVDHAGWLLLGFEHAAGRHADLSPGSPDLPLVAGAAEILATTLTPAPVDAPRLATHWARLAAWRRLRHDPPADLHPWSHANLDRFVAWERLAFSAVDGASLAHTDLHSLNLLAGRELRVVDWAWSRSAAPWVDAGFLVLRLIEAGHTPAEAEHWAAGIEVWAAVPDEARTAFAVAVLGIWEFLQRDSPLPHRERLTAAARSWVRHRLG